ncbi:hypothetical protein JW933_11455 [candidate division FCPU426 bacterium]|nr:hypothetical protein [candidate division FCPU426 bacterium]
MPELLRTLIKIWFKPKEFFAGDFNRQSQRESLLMALVMMCLGQGTEVVVMLTHSPYHWLGFFEHLAVQASAWFFFAVVMSICANIMRGAGGFKTALQLGSNLLVVNVFVFILLPLAFILEADTFAGLKNIPPIYKMYNLIFSIIAIVIIFYVLLRFIYVAYTGIRQVHHFSPTQAVLALLATSVLVAVMAIVVKIPFYAFSH